MKFPTRYLKRLALSFLFIGSLAACAAVYFGKPTGLPERHGRVSSKFFVGTGSNQPLIVGLGGAEGGNAWASNYWKPQRDKFLAQGYAILAVGYFGTEESSPQLDRIALEGVHNAVMEASKDTRVNSKQIIVIGGSKGAELALTLASFYPEYSAIVAIVPGSAVFPSLTVAMNTSSFSYQDRELPFVPAPWSATPALIKGDLRTAFEKMMENKQAMSEAAIKVENIRGPILLLSATKDEMWPSTEMSNQMVQRLKDKGFTYKVQHIAFEGDHAEPTKHFDVIERFLATEVKRDNAIEDIH